MDKNIEISLLFDFYGRLLREKQRSAVSLYHNDDLSLSEISDILGITRQGVRDLVKRSEAELFEYEEKLGLYKRFEKVQGSARHILSCAQTLRKENPDRELIDEIIASAEDIIEQEE